MASTSRHPTWNPLTYHPPLPSLPLRTHLSLGCCDFRAANFFNEWRSLKLIVVCGVAAVDDLAHGLCYATQPGSDPGMATGLGYGLLCLPWYLLNRQLTSNFGKWNASRPKRRSSIRCCFSIWISISIDFRAFPDGDDATAGTKPKPLSGIN